MLARKVKDFLNEHGIRYVVIHHSPAYTAQEIAASAHIPGKELAKAVVVKLDGRMALAVLPASYRVDFTRLAAAAGVSRAELASEEEFKGLFPECELGAMPPFGNLYGMEVYAARRLAQDEEIAFNACSHRELIRMRYEDFARLVQPREVSFAL
jgi:Ala-tRNA(Pro) deacylase